MWQCLDGAHKFHALHADDMAGCSRSLGLILISPYQTIRDVLVPVRKIAHMQINRALLAAPALHLQYRAPILGWLD